MMVYALNSGSGATNWSTAITFDTSRYSYQEGYDLVAQVDAKVVVAGRACRFAAPYGTDFALARLDGTTGLLDTTFDGDGKLTTNFGVVTGGCELNPSYDTAYAVMESEDGNALYAVGKTNYGGVDQFAAVSYLQTNGSRDAAFHKAGLPNGLATGPAGIAYAGRVQAADGHLVAGGAGTPGTTSSDFIIARFLGRETQGTPGGGDLDPDFGSGGWVRTDFDKSNTFTTGYDECRGLDIVRGGGLNHQGNIVAGGFTAATSTSTPFLALAEYLPRNKILVESPIGFAAPASTGAPSPDAPSTLSLRADGFGTSLLTGEKQDDDLISPA